ncbi:MAG: glycine cleavage system aminomethyltransferase GcvT [Chloroflexia bacterium]|nr:glycine cleavage system aminomethyltransferase GcvT [Chloroflexia bacterium]
MTHHDEPTVATVSPDEAPRRTALHDRHVALGARMVPFAGWEMPIQYTGILAEHRAVRSGAGLFDLGHMGQVDVRGPDALAYLQHVTTNDVSKLGPGAAQYGLLPNAEGGVIDDIITYRRPDAAGYMVVINAANAAKDVAWLRRARDERTDLDVEVTDMSDTVGMIAIQGPHAETITQGLTDVPLGDIPGFHGVDGEVAGIPMFFARTGYTGEDGFEFYPPQERTAELWDALMAAGAAHGIGPIGLGARDTLRLEARMPLYGNELADDIDPYEAGVGWAVKLDKGAFIGRDALARIKERGATRRTIGFRIEGRSAPPRGHYPLAVDGVEVGHVTSGAFSPTLGENIGLGLVERSVAGVGKPIDVIIRGKPVRAVQVALPFYRRQP